MNRYDAQRRRLTWVLGSVFAALMAASAVLIVQSLDRLRFEAFHGQRVLAEEVVARVNAELIRVVTPEDARPPTDYDFLVVSGDRYVQRSPLSRLNPETILPGVVGFFQVDADGRFSTPLLPMEVDDPDALALSGAEVAERRALQQRLRALLERESPEAAEELVAVPRVERMTVEPSIPLEASSRGRPSSEGRQADVQDAQKIFEQLSNAETLPRSSSGSSLGKVSDLELEESLAKRALARAPAAAPAESPAATERNREVRQVTLAPPDADTPLTPRILAFQSAVDPFSLALLDDRHLVLYRRVWLEGQRIQGAVIEQQPFLDALIGRTFVGTSLARDGHLLVAFDGDVIGVYPPTEGAREAVPAPELEGELLLRARLTAPASPLELVFSVADLPLGPGAAAVGWASAVMALVLGGGFCVLHRLGRHHIRLAEQQQDFVSAVSHELKTPLTSIRMYGEILKAGWADEEKKRTYYDYILSESERLSRLIGNVLQLARITRRGTLELAMKEVPAARLLDEVGSKIASAVAASGVALEQATEDEAGAAVVAVDEDAFVQVMINLVDNAIKFSAHAERRAVEIGCRASADWVEFRVRDYGPGIARDQMKKIFRLFYRSENELTRETVGTGIGLALVRELVDQMGGNVDVVNRQPGAEFRVRLRRRA